MHLLKGVAGVMLHLSTKPYLRDGASLFARLSRSFRGVCTCDFLIRCNLAVLSGLDLRLTFRILDCLAWGILLITGPQVREYPEKYAQINFALTN